MSAVNEQPPNSAPASPAASLRRARPTAPPPSEQRVLAAVESELRGEIERRWPTYYPARAGGAPPVVTMRPRQCGFSALYRVELRFADPPGVEQFMVKIKREGRFGSFLVRDLSARTLASSRAEYDEHVRAFRFFDARNDGLRVVRPLDYIEAYNAILVNHAAGRDLSKVVNEGGADALPALRRCGQWWQLFHRDLHGATERPWDAEVVDGYVERRVKRLRQIGVPTGALDALRSEISSTARRVVPAGVPVGLIHGDCKLRHVWATSDAIEVLDFGNTRTGDSWLDLAALVVELSLYSLWTTRLDSEPHVEHMRTLTRAYFGAAPPAAFALYVVDCLLKKWHRRLRDWGGGAGLRQVRRALGTVGLEGPVDRLYLDRWFLEQIRAWLAAAEGRAPSWLRPVAQ